MGIVKKESQLPYPVPFGELKRFAATPNKGSSGGHSLKVDYVTLNLKGEYDIETTSETFVRYGVVTLPDMYVIESIEFKGKKIPVMLNAHTGLNMVFIEDTISSARFAINGTELVYLTSSGYIEKNPLFINYYTKAVE